MRALAVLGLLGGLALTVALVLSHGAGAVWQAAATLGLSGFAILLGMRAVVVSAMGLAWWVLGRGRPDAAPGRFVWGRLLRDAAADTLPLSQLGGYVIGARAAALAGLAGRFAAASTVVDVSLELVGQLGYVLFGLALLAWLRPGTALVWPALGAVAAVALLVALFLALQARGAGAVERVGKRLVAAWLGPDAEASGGLQAEISALHARRARNLLCAAAHLACWMLNGLDTWVTLRLMGVPAMLPAALVIDSLLYGLRSLAFLVPNAVGVQEGGFILFGGLFGVTPDTALALSLVRRARDVTIGVPALLLWQVLEGRAAWRRRSAAPDPPRSPVLGEGRG